METATNIKQTSVAVSEENLLDDAPQVVHADLRKFNKAKDQVDKAISALNSIGLVNNKAELDHAMETMKKASMVEKIIEAKRVELVKPFNDSVKKINTYAKDLTASIGPAITQVKNKVLAFNKAEEERVARERFEARVQQLTGLGFAEDRAADVMRLDDYTVTGSVIKSYSEDGWASLLATIGQHIESKNQQKLAKAKEESDFLQDFGTDEQKKAAEEKLNSVSSAQPVVITRTAPVQEATKVNGVTKRWTFEITDAAMVPREFLAIDETAIRKAIAEGARTIAGVRIFQQEGLTLR